MRSLACAFTLSLAAACGGPPAAETAEPRGAPRFEPDPEPSPELDRRFEAALLEAAGSYRDWGRVDERPNLAPTLCRAPVHPGDHGASSHVRLSEAGAASEHGRKLYYLFARDRRAYLDPAEPVPAGTAIVKESWEARPGEPSAPREPSPLAARSAPPPVTWYRGEDGEVMVIGARADLFIMLKLDPETPGTDEGWVYGTTDPAGKVVTSAGKVATCMGCHLGAPRERLFGLQPTETLAEPPSAPW